MQYFSSYKYRLHCGDNHCTLADWNSYRKIATGTRLTTKRLSGTIYESDNNKSIANISKVKTYSSSYHIQKYTSPYYIRLLNSLFHKNIYYKTERIENISEEIKTTLKNISQEKIPPSHITLSYSDRISSRRYDPYYFAAKKKKLASITIISWNVCGLRALFKKHPVNIISKKMADIICVQEIRSNYDKLKEILKNHIYSVNDVSDNITFSSYNNLYYFYLNAAESYTKNGVGIFTKIKPKQVIYDMDNHNYINDGRVITAEFNDFYLINVYVPQSGINLEKLDQRLKWDEAFLSYAQSLKSKKNVVIAGDFNVTASFNDFYFVDKNIRFPSCTAEERENFHKLIDTIGCCDAFQYNNKERITPAYTFWSYQNRNRLKNQGMRLDYFLTPNILSLDSNVKVYDCNVLSYITGSDHCPIILAIV